MMMMILNRSDNKIMGNPGNTGMKVKTMRFLIT